jgi:hypothetical protein
MADEHGEICEIKGIMKGEVPPKKKRKRLKKKNKTRR